MHDIEEQQLDPLGYHERGCLYPSRLKYTDSVDLSNGHDHYLFKEDLSKNTLYSNQ